MPMWRRDYEEVIGDDDDPDDDEEGVDLDEDMPPEEERLHQGLESLEGDPWGDDGFDPEPIRTVRI